MHDESQKSITQIRDIIEDEKKRRTVPILLCGVLLWNEAKNRKFA